MSIQQRAIQEKHPNERLAQSFLYYSLYVSCSTKHAGNVYRCAGCPLKLQGKRSQPRDAGSWRGNGAKRPARLDGRIRRTGFWLRWDGNGCQEITGETLLRLLNSIIVWFLDSLLVSWPGGGGGGVKQILSLILPPIRPIFKNQTTFDSSVLHVCFRTWANCSKNSSMREGWKQKIHIRHVKWLM